MTDVTTPATEQPDELDDDEGIEYGSYFEGPCTCEHSEEAHGWVGCEYDDDCACTAAWVE